MLFATCPRGCCLPRNYQWNLHAVLSVDHNNVTEEVRGLLCTRYNTGIGFLKDDTVITDRATQYLLERRNYAPAIIQGEKISSP